MKQKTPIKRVLAALLMASVLVLVFAACKKNPPEDDENASDPTQETTDFEFATDAGTPVLATPGNWQIAISGVEGITQFTSEEAQYLQLVEQEMTSTNSAGFTVTNTYKGITLRSLLAYLGVSNVSNVTVTSVAGNSSTYETAIAMAETTLLAWEIDGAPIETEPPLRMCPASGTAEMYISLVSALTVTPAAPTLVTPGFGYTYPVNSTYPAYVPSYYYPTISTARSTYPNYTYPSYSYPTYAPVTYPTTKQTVPTATTKTTAKTTAPSTTYPVSSTATDSSATTTAPTDTTSTTTTTTTKPATTTSTTRYTYTNRSTTTKAPATTTKAPVTTTWPDGWPSP
ncbi:MAG: molybdopterin-dependent oxidoreductase [Oscillospiraceae bacterium]|jgi:hypothetical protein|nr:molybdopterin-dependent oxidoreductase [Oscillospiraceae bacterium]